MSINIQERVLDTLFDIAVEEKGVCEDMDRTYTEHIPNGISFVMRMHQPIRWIII